MGRSSGRNQASQSGATSLGSPVQHAHKTYYPVCYDARGSCKRSTVEAGIDWCSSAGD